MNDYLLPGNKLRFQTKILIWLCLAENPSLLFFFLTPLKAPWLSVFITCPYLLFSTAAPLQPDTNIWTNWNSTGLSAPHPNQPDLSLQWLMAAFVQPRKPYWITPNAAPIFPSFQHQTHETDSTHHLCPPNSIPSQSQRNAFAFFLLTSEEHGALFWI